jgi:hypothetical protein
MKVSYMHTQGMFRGANWQTQNARDVKPPLSKDRDSESNQIPYREENAVNAARPSMASGTDESMFRLKC